VGLGALNSCSRLSAAICPAVEPNTRAGLFLFAHQRLLWLKPYTRPAAIIVSKLDSRRLESLADCDSRALMQPLVLSRRNTVSGLTTALAASSGTPIPRAARAILHCVASNFAGAIHIPGEPDTQAALKRRGYQWRRWRRAATNAARGYARPWRELQRRHPAAGEGQGREAGSSDHLTCAPMAE
jgi:hypothetical protein